jgi:hypothetical protein
MSHDIDKTKSRPTDRAFDFWQVSRHGSTYTVEIRYRAPTDVLQGNTDTPRFIAISKDPDFTVASGSLVDLRKKIEAWLDAWLNPTYANKIALYVKYPTVNDYNNDTVKELIFVHTKYVVGTLGNGEIIHRRAADTGTRRVWGRGDLLASLSNGMTSVGQVSVIDDTPENRAAIEQFEGLLDTLAKTFKDLFSPEKIAQSLASINQSNAALQLTLIKQEP